MARVVLLCTANQCRSPMAEALLRAARPELDVVSAGRLPGGVAASPGAVEVLGDLGLDLSGHVSQTATAPLLAGSDLVVGMAREHVRDAVLLCPDVRGRAFTLKELVRRAEGVGGRPPGQPLGAWLAAAGRGRDAADLLGASDDDDVADPIGRSIEHYRSCARELEDLLGRLADLAFPPATAPAPGGHRARRERYGRRASRTGGRSGWRRRG